MNKNLIVIAACKQMNQNHIIHVENIYRFNEGSCPGIFEWVPSVVVDDHTRDSWTHTIPIQGILGIIWGSALDYISRSVRFQSKVIVQCGFPILWTFYCIDTYK